MAEDQYTLGKKATEQIAQTIREVSRRMMNETQTRARWHFHGGGGGGRLQVVLLTDLFAAVNTKRDPSTATARILRKKSDGDLTLSTDEITIVNRFQHISVDAGTYAKAEWIDGEWQLYAADCATGASSESV